MKGAFKLDNICNRLQTGEEESSIDKQELLDIKSTEETLIPSNNSTPSKPSTPEPSNSGRKNRRKSRKPVNIVRYQKELQQESFADDLEDYKIVSKDVDLDENENIADQAIPDHPKSVSEYANSSRFDDVDKDLVDGSFSIDSSGALDLSVGKHDEEDLASNEPVVTPIPLPLSPKAIDLPVSSHVVQAACKSASNHVISPKTQEPKVEKLEPKKSGPPEELTNYAESTMQELLSMYGLQGDSEAAKLGLKVPAISQALMMQHQLMISQHQPPPPAPVSAPVMAKKELPPQNMQVTPKKEPAYNKIVDNVNKLANLPAGE